MDSARTLREAHNRATMLDVLSDVATALEEAYTSETVIKAVGEGTLRLCAPDKVAVFLRENGRVRCAWSHGFPEAFLAELVDTAWELPNGHVLAGDGPVFVSNVDDLPPDSALRDWADRGGYTAFGLLPLRHEKHTLGYLGCYWARPHEPPAYEREVMETFARLAAAALARVRVHEELRRTSEALREALQARDDMLRNVTHELRTPLTMVRGYAELIEMGLVTDLQEIQNQVRVILRNALHLQHLIDQLLLFQRLRFGEVEMPFSRLDLVPWLEQLVKEWEQPMAEVGIRLVYRPEADHLPVDVFEAYLRQVMHNLLDNARKFSPDGGTVEVQARQVGNEALVAVRDEGIGIPSDKLDKIFDRFYQVDPSPTRRFGGMGIGLALCKEIIERHGGRIWAESPGEGQGTTLFFTLPLARTNPTAAERAS